MTAFIPGDPKNKAPNRLSRGAQTLGGLRPGDRDTHAWFRKLGDPLSRAPGFAPPPYDGFAVSLHTHPTCQTTEPSGQDLPDNSPKFKGRSSFF